MMDERLRERLTFYKERIAYLKALIKMNNNLGNYKEAQINAMELSLCKTVYIELQYVRNVLPTNLKKELEGE
ncbi:MAG: hypothetical protein ACXADY_23065 [Candidatus Hodarchaeales archaeon]|jgi:hypothetical protein